MSENQTELARLIGGRVREARERLGLSQEQLAAAVELPRTALSAVEHGKRQVSTAELLRFAAALSRPFDFFLRDPEPELSFQPLLRIAPACDDADAVAVRATLARFEDLCRGAAELEELNQLPRPELPRPAVEATSARDAAALAEWARAQLALGQTVPAAQLRARLEERFGVMTFVLRSPSRLSGASFYHPRCGGCVLVIQATPGPMLFTLAHELAHLLSHRDTPTVEEDLFARSPREQFANAFAAALLMPAAAVRELLAAVAGSAKDLTPVEVSHCARHLGVSPSALLWRLQGLRLIGSGQREALLHARAPGQAPSGDVSLWPALPERLRFLAARALQRESVTVGWLRELWRDEAGQPMSRDSLLELLNDSEAPDSAWSTAPLSLDSADEA